ncbi:MAG: hypothetical protein EGQ38_01365 [Dialister sp.]|nr:hypothetical protein [Dialister sp.]
MNQCFLENHSRPFLWKGADKRSEAGLASANVGVPFHAANIRPEGAACIVIGIFAAKPTPSLLYPLPQTRPYHFLFKGRII